MIELPEALTLAKQFNTTLNGKKVSRVLPPTKPHKFCWFFGEPEKYEEQICTSKIVSADGFGIFAELTFDNGMKLCINDGVNPRYITNGMLPKDFQLAIVFEDGDILAFSVAMYGGIVLHNGAYENEYYLKSKSYVSPFSPEFTKLFYDTLESTKDTISAKAFLATEQRFPGIGNGVLQDILFDAGIHPKRKLRTLDVDERKALLSSVIAVLRQMTDCGGRDTEKDLFGNRGGYITKMSKNITLCPKCGGKVTKEAFLGGSVYFCSECQCLN